MQEGNQNKKTKAIEQALASLQFDNIDLTPEYLEQYSKKQEQEVELKPYEEKGIVKKLIRKEGNKNEQ